MLLRYPVPGFNVKEQPDSTIEPDNDDNNTTNKSNMVMRQGALWQFLNIPEKI